MRYSLSQSESWFLYLIIGKWQYLAFMVPTWFREILFVELLWHLSIAVQKQETVLVMNMHTDDPNKGAFRIYLVLIIWSAGAVGGWWRDTMKTFLRISKKGENNEQWIIWEDIEKELDHTVGLQKRVDLFLGRECWWRLSRWKIKEEKAQRWEPAPQETRKEITKSKKAGLNLKKSECSSHLIP